MQVADIWGMGACMNGYMMMDGTDRWMGGRIDGQTDGWMDRRINTSIDVVRLNSRFFFITKKFEDPKTTKSLHLQDSTCWSCLHTHSYLC